MEGFDSFTIAVLVGGSLILLIFLAMLILDKGKRPAPPASAPGKVAGKR